MFINATKVLTEYTRVSKLGKTHVYKRYKTFLRFRCDCCDAEFVRERAKMDPKRVSNNYFHVCPVCDAKRFAQKKGAEKRTIWNLPASSMLPIGKH